MRLSELARGLGGLAQARLRGDPEIRRIINDSRAAQPGDLFVAVRGETADGHTFVPAVIAAGAAAVAVEDAQVAGTDMPALFVPDARLAVARLASLLYEEPTRRLKLVGITGTNGKTTTTYLLEAICAAAGLPVGVIGTVGYRFAGQTLPATHTTPDPIELQRLFADMVSGGVRAVAMETSSHALSQRRVDGCDFSVAAFTNLTQDHLDYHVTMDGYFAAKKRLFTDLLPASRAPHRAAVVNLDDPRGDGLAASCRALANVVDTLTYGVEHPRADIRAIAPRFHEGGVLARVESPRGAFDLTSPLVGAYNLENLLCAVGCALGLGIDTSAIASALADCRGAPGRLERVDNDRGIGVFVDYAHTPDALGRVLAAVRAQTKGRLIAVFGCGGDRDRSKRPLMGGVAARIADLLVVTSDNPRTEEARSIVEMIVPGVTDEGMKALLGLDDARQRGARGYLVEVDRRRAIELAIHAARAGDAIVIAGKGHEDYQILGKTKVHFDDREEARALLGAP